MIRKVSAIFNGCDRFWSHFSHITAAGADYSLQTLNSIQFHSDSCKRYMGKNYVNIFGFTGNLVLAIWVFHKCPTQPTWSLVDKSPSQLSLMLLIGNDIILWFPGKLPSVPPVGLQLAVKYLWGMFPCCQLRAVLRHKPQARVKPARRGLR